jgi:hypothetical protein
MTKLPAQSVSISNQNIHAPLSKGQKAFNSLIKQIERKRAALLAWEQALPPYQQKYVNELVPLMNATTEFQIKIVHALDVASGLKILTKGERRKISELIVAMTEVLLPLKEDLELKALYNKHSRSDYDADEEIAKQDMKAMFEDILGVDLGDDFDLDSPEELFQRAQAKANEQQAQWEERQVKRKKSTKQLASEAKREAEALQLQQSIREIYRKLASALHPDRETDSIERERKTALMQRVNQAYEKTNLLQLLELQLEVEQIDHAVIANLGDARLKHYNKILQGQVHELDTEILRFEDRFRMQFGSAPFAPVTVNSIMVALTTEIAESKRTVRELKKDLEVVQDPARLKPWLKTLQRVSRHDDFLF